MKLNEEQKKHINAFLRYAAAKLEVLPPDVRAAKLADMKAHIAKRLEVVTNPMPNNKEIQKVINECRETYLKPIDVLRPEQEKIADNKELPEKETKLLGVCCRIANKVKIGPAWVRASFILLTLITGPAAILIYMGIYFEMHHIYPEMKKESINWSGIGKRVLATIACLVLFYAATKGVLFCARYMFGAFFPDEELVAGKWDWLEVYEIKLLIVMLFVTIPVALLGSMPVPSGWRETLKKLVRAEEATYLLVLSLGIASSLTGILLATAQKLIT